MDANWKYSHGVGQSRFHVVLVPYRRYEMFGRTDVQKTLRDIFFATAEAHRFEILEQEIVKDHVHLFIGIRPSQSISEVIQYLKGTSSRKLRLIFPEMKGFSARYLWSKGKFFRPISEVNEETIRHYITESQGKHKHPSDNKAPEREWLPKCKTQQTQTPHVRGGRPPLTCEEPMLLKQRTLDAFAS